MFAIQIQGNRVGILRLSRTGELEKSDKKKILELAFERFTYSK